MLPAQATKIRQRTVPALMISISLFQTYFINTPKPSNRFRIYQPLKISTQ
jgi:hypothetical protein